MAVERVWVSNYRSLRSVRVAPSALTVIVGPNGSGKSNLYKALGLIAEAAHGRLAAAMLAEGGMPSALFAGERQSGPVRMTLGAQLDDYRYELELGLPVELGSPFSLDPIVKSERIWTGTKPTRRTLLCDRTHASAQLADADGETVRIPTGLNPSESILAQVGDPKTFPELWLLREHMRTWRFYHHFDTSNAAAARHPRAGVRTRVLDDRGDDLAAALKTIEEVGDRRLLESVVGEAFPGCALSIEASAGRFAVTVTQPGLVRPLTGVELSDGTLRFLCLTAALLTTDAPGLMVLNEPETSLHSQLLAPLARLITEMSTRTQVWVSTHSPELATLLASADGASLVQLAFDNGTTRALLDTGGDDDEEEEL
jgi:predicted ATPase